MTNNAMETIERRQQQVLCDKKWHVLNKKTWLFRYIPFVDFVFGSGSLAIGNVDTESDFDVLIGARTGRIFTARFFAALFFGLFGWRRAKADHRESAANKICLNHFVTPAAYKLRLQPNAYWKMLYRALVPIYGAPEAIQKFFDANAAWLGVSRVVYSDTRHIAAQPSALKRFLEFSIDTFCGNWMEELLKKYQIRRIEAGLEPSQEFRAPHQMTVLGAAEAGSIELKPLIVYNDEELEFHPDPAVIEMVR